jgi:hypothetical protein
MRHLVSSSMARPRYNAVLVGLLALIAGGLAALGVYAVMTYTVSQRTSEIGIRMALGARPGNVLRLVLGQGVLITLTGLVVGVVAALAMSQRSRCRNPFTRCCFRSRPQISGPTRPSASVLAPSHWRHRMCLLGGRQWSIRWWQFATSEVSSAPKEERCDTEHRGP